MNRSRYTMAELLAASDYSQPQPPEEREWVDAPAVGREIIATSPEAYEAFLGRLDMPPQPNERLRKTMQTPAPWKKA